MKKYLFCAALEDEESGTEEVLSMVLVNTPLGRKETLIFLQDRVWN